MSRLTLVMGWLIISMSLSFTAAQPAGASQKLLQGSWTAIKAERDGKAADAVVGHRLSFTGKRFEIRSKDDQVLFAGTVRVGARAIDFVHQQGNLKGKTWQGIYALSGDSLSVCDNAADLKKRRPTSFAAKRGSGYVLITFERAKT
ncbi:MAG TPA: TIGR03067 domain-containing protein [Hyphomicrobiaceae bacterium]|nr:TIGR03067 domain-containing protein [Hyphomicrobiaceae bacterium]